MSNEGDEVEDSGVDVGFEVGGGSSSSSSRWHKCVLLHETSSTGYQYGFLRFWLKMLSLALGPVARPCAITFS